MDNSLESWAILLLNFGCGCDWPTENQTFKSLKFKLHDKLCHGVFLLFFMRTNMTFSPETNNK